MIYDIEEELEKYELAKNDFSKVPAKDWQSTEVVTNEDGRTYTAGVVDGMLFELQPEEEMPVVAKNQNNTSMQFDSEGTGYDLDIAKKLNFEPSKIEDENKGHMQSAAPISELIKSGVFTEEDLLKFGIPENSSMLLKGMNHESVDKELNAPHNLEYKKINTPLGERYIGFPKQEVALNSETNQELNTPVIQENAMLPNAEAPVIPNLIKDTTKAIVKGGAVGGRNTTSFISSILGSPGDLGNFLVNLTGTEDYKGIIPGSEAINRQFQAGLSWLDENLMPDIGVDEWANEPYNYETYGEIAEMVAQFATPGLPAAKIISGTKAVEKLWRRADLWVEGMKAPNPFVRGMVWGSIADAAAFPEKQLTLTGDLAEYFAGKTPEERTAFADLVVNVFQKNPEHAEIVNRLKGALEGFIIAGGLEGGVKLAVKTPPFLNIMVKAASKINWKELIDRVEIDPNTLSSGGFGGITLKKKPTDTEPGILAFHGSGADFDEFKLEKIGTGEGNQVFGHGLYFSDSKDIATFYRKQILNDNVRKGKLNVKYKGKTIPKGDTAEAEAFPETATLNQIVDYMNGTKGNFPDPKDAKNALIENIKKEIKLRKVNNREELNKLIIDSYNIDLKDLEKINPEEIIVDIGKVYSVNIKTVMDDMLNYDMPIFQQSKIIQNKIKKIVDDYKLKPLTKETTGEDIQDLLAIKFNKIEGNKITYDEKKVSEILSSSGFKGIKYNAGTISGIDSDKSNYVIFDDKIIDIMAKMGIVGPMAISAIKNNKEEQVQDNSM